MTESLKPVTFDTMDGVPHAAASVTTIPQPSFTEGSNNAHASCIRRTFSSRISFLRKKLFLFTIKTFFVSFNFLICTLRFFSSLPYPTRYNFASGYLGTTTVIAATDLSGLLFLTNLATKTNVG